MPQFIGGSFNGRTAVSKTANRGSNPCSPAILNLQVNFMVTIIKQPDPQDRKEFTCFKCGCVYQADKWDYEYENRNCEWGYRLKCPICKDNSWHKYSPYLKKYIGVRDV